MILPEKQASEVTKASEVLFVLHIQF